MKLFIVLLIISFFLLLLYWRMRPYLHAVQKALRVVRQMQEGTGAGLGGLHQRGNRSATTQTSQPDNRQLIKCAGCGTWVLEARAVTPAGQRAAYCSHSCYEENKLAAQTAHRH